MIVILDNRPEVASGFLSCFEREGVAAVEMSHRDFSSWVLSQHADEVHSIEAVLVGECDERFEIAKQVRRRSCVPLIALTESKNLVDTLDLFAAGYDDVVRKPVHVREILARAAVIRQRLKGGREVDRVGEIHVFFDGRDPLVVGEPLLLPRRERRILEYFVMNKGRRVSKTQIFNFVYGLYSEEIDECVIESHISKLRKKLRQVMGFDPIDSQRYLGYRLIDTASAERGRDALAGSSQAQDDRVHLAISGYSKEMTV